jgi:hypothetical protein
MSSAGELISFSAKRRSAELLDLVEYGADYDAQCRSLEIKLL